MFRLVAPAQVGLIHSVAIDAEVQDFSVGTDLPQRVFRIARPSLVVTDLGAVGEGIAEHRNTLATRRRGRAVDHLRRFYSQALRVVGVERRANAWPRGPAEQRVGDNERSIRAVVLADRGVHPINGEPPGRYVMATKEVIAIHVGLRHHADGALTNHRKRKEARDSTQSELEPMCDDPAPAATR
jgi:hypothetical protein